MIVNGQLELATFEVLSSDPSSSVTGRFWYNSADGHAKFDNGAAKSAFLLNDAKIIIGTSGTAATNVRVHRGGTSLLQFVLGSDTTAEGTLSTSLAQTSSRIENYTDAGKPAAGNTGRLVYLTDLEEVKVDNGTSFIYPIKLNSIAPTTTKGDLFIYNGTTNTRQPVGSDGLFLKADSSSATGVSYATASDISTATKTANYTLTSTDGAIIADGSGGAFTLTLPSAASVPGKRYILKRSDNTLANVVTISGTIDGATDWTLNTQNESYEIFSNGTEYKMIEHRTAMPTTSWTPTFTGFGTVTAITAGYWRTGAYLEGQLIWTNGTVSATVATLTLPTSIVHAVAIASPGIIVGGYANNTAIGLGAVTANSGSTTTLGLGSPGGNFAPVAGSTVSNSSIKMTAWFKVKISGWKE